MYRPIEKGKVANVSEADAQNQVEWPLFQSMKTPKKENKSRGLCKCLQFNFQTMLVAINVYQFSESTSQLRFSYREEL